MPVQHAFDAQAAHKLFSASCFNQAWKLIEKRDRTPDDDEQMIRLGQSSIWHWTQRADCTPRNMAIGYWQVSRIYALVGQADHARHYAQLSLDHCGNEEPFLTAYAYEALSRAELVAGNRQKSRELLAPARRLAELVPDAHDKRPLLDDLKSLEADSSPT